MANPTTLPKFKRIDALITHLLNSGETDDVKLHEALKSLSDSGLTLTQFLTSLQTSIGNGLIGKDGITGKNGGSGPPGPAGAAGPPGPAGGSGGVPLTTKGGILYNFYGGIISGQFTPYSIAAVSAPVLMGGWFRRFGLVLTTAMPALMTGIWCLRKSDINLSVYTLPILPGQTATALVDTAGTVQVRFSTGDRINLFYTGLADGTSGTLPNLAGASAEYVQDDSGCHCGTHIATTVPLSSTLYYGLSDNPGGGETNYDASEANVLVVAPFAGTANNLEVITTTTQSATGSLVISLTVNGAPSGLSVTVPAGSLAGTRINFSSTIAFAKGDTLSIQSVNNATTTSASVARCDFNIYGASQGQTLIDSLGDRAAVLAGVTAYFPFGWRGQVASALLASLPCPRDGVISDLYIVTSTAQPGGGDFIFTVLLNGIATALIVTIPAGSGASTFSSALNFNVVSGDRISLQGINNSAGNSAIVVSAALSYA